MSPPELGAPPKTLCFAISYSGLSSAEIAAHIHGPDGPRRTSMIRGTVIVALVGGRFA